MVALRDAGAIVELQGQIEQPFFTAPASALAVDGEGVQVFEFADTGAAAAAARGISSDGLTVGTAKPFWIGPPHFYRAGRLIVLYLGTNARVLAQLRSALGPPFAGSGS